MLALTQLLSAVYTVIHYTNNHVLIQQYQRVEEHLLLERKFRNYGHTHMQIFIRVHRLKIPVLLVKQLVFIGARNSRIMISC